MFEPYAARTHEKMKDVLMKPDAEGPAIHYYMIRGGTDKRNVTIWDTGTVGGEYIKAYGHYHVDDLPEVYWFVAGEGVALLQKMAVVDGKPQEDTLEEFKAIRVKAGDTLHIPPRYGHLVANVGSEWFVTVDDSPVAIGDSASMPTHADYKPVQRMQGFAFYVVEKDGAPFLVPNKRYKEVRKADFGGIPHEDF